MWLETGGRAFRMQRGGTRSHRPVVLAALLVAGISWNGLLRTPAARAADVASIPALSTPPPQQQPARIPRQTFRKTGAIEAQLRDANGRGIGGAQVTLRNLSTGELREAVTSGDGIIRVLDLSPGRYELKIHADGYQDFSRSDLDVSAAEVVDIELALEALPTSTPPGSRVPNPGGTGAAPQPGLPAPTLPPYRELRRRPDELPGEPAPAEELPRTDQIYQPMPDRWYIPMPDWNRYGRRGENPYTKGHWWDPFNRNKLKGDYPIFGEQTFLNLTLTSDTFFDGRRVPAPSDVSSARPGSSDFFGHGEQADLQQNFRVSVDLFHGDTSFRPVDWRIRVTPEFNVNYLATRELGIVNIDVRAGTTRFDSHIGLQEAFAEYKIADLSPNYDFLSVRAGIQSFTSDFRGFIFVDEQPGLRLFGNLHSNRWEYNAAYFNMLEKDTNSGLNSFALRHQQVIIANLYMQDFVKPGYTTQFSVHYNKDEPTIHFDTNDFLVRPAPVGAVRPHRIEAAYLGWTGNGHFGRLNVNHAFYQALGRDSLNPIAGRPVTIDARMAALELSVDKDWARLRGSFFYASGDGNPRDGRAGGFDSIEDFPAFAGGIFSFWNREAIRLTGTGVQLTPPDSLLPSLRSNKDEGQANFVNPGIWIFNAGADFDITPKLRTVLNVNYLRFDRTEPLQLLLFEAPIHHAIGLDYGIGFQYRPPLTENITLTTGASALSPGKGFEDIYSRKTLFSLFANFRVQF